MRAAIGLITALYELIKIVVASLKSIRKNRLKKNVEGLKEAKDASDREKSNRDLNRWINRY